VISCHGQQSSLIRQESELTFTAPWSQSGMETTHAQLWHTRDTLYFAFDVVDTILVSHKQSNFHQGIGSSDRVELFFSTDSLLSDYYGMEIGYDDRILSFHGQHYRQIDYDWSWPNAVLQTQSTLTEKGYHCRGSIAISYLRNLHLVQEGRSNLYIGVFRADYHDVRDPSSVTWITHRDPKTQSPDFHTTSAFFYYMASSVLVRLRNQQSLILYQESLSTTSLREHALANVQSTH